MKVDRKKIAALATVSVCWLWAGFGEMAQARRGIEPIYEDPWDLAAGGASLTRATQVGLLFSNPALLAWGGGFHRWLGTEFSLFTNRESVDTVREVLAGQKSDAASSENGATDGGSASDQTSSDETSEFLDKVFEAPIHFGATSTLSWITRAGGIAVFNRVEPDIRARQYGTNGLPEVRFQAESWHGAIAGGALPTPWRWLSVGAATKWLYASEPEIGIELTDQEGIASLQGAGALEKLTTHSTGFGLDAGISMLFQGRWIDFSLAAKADDIGGTKLTGGDDPPQIQQINSVGTGLTFHTGADALHFSLDWRDVSSATHEPMFKKVRAGTKLMIRKWVGIATGVHHGYPTFGAEVDLLLVRLTATSWTREFSNTPGGDPRRLLLISLAAGL